MAQHTLTIGYDRTDDVEQAQANTRDALERWKASVERADLVGVGPVDVELVQSDGLAGIGQYAVKVTGEAIPRGGQ